MPKLEGKLDPSVYEKLVQKHGICVECGEFYDHHYDEPFASCGCHTTEWTGDFTPYMKLQIKIRQVNQAATKLLKETPNA